MNKKLILKILSLTILVVVLFIILSIKPSFRITGFDPKLGNISTNTPYFDIYFSKAISDKNLSLSSTQGIVSSYSVIGENDLRIFFKLPIIEKHKYTIIIDSVSSIGGKTITNDRLNFTPIYSSANTLSKSQAKYVVSHQDTSNSTIYGTTLVNLLPFTGAGNEYLINYSTINQVPYITITGTSGKAYSDARLWITNHGYNTSELNIKYIDQQP